MAAYLSSLSRICSLRASTFFRAGYHQAYGRRYLSKGLLLCYFIQSLSQYYLTGFDKFKLNPKQQTSKGKQEVPPSSGKTGGSGGGSSGGKKDPGKKGWELINQWVQEAMQPQHRTTWLSLGGVMIGWYLLVRSTEQHRQISWQEFRTNYLEQGEVSIQYTIYAKNISIV